MKFSELKREEFTKAFIDIWCESLSDLEPEWIEFGCRVYLKSMKFFPMPGDIREIVEDERETRRQFQLTNICATAREVEERERAVEESSRNFMLTSEIMRRRRAGAR